METAEHSITVQKTCVFTVSVEHSVPVTPSPREQQLPHGEEQHSKEKSLPWISQLFNLRILMSPNIELITCQH